MVKGLELFRDHFSRFNDCYILIGGSAASLVMEESGLAFRSTKDLDIVLMAESLTPEFLAAIKGFVESGRYERRQRSDGREQFFRFQSPATPGYPEMLELFSRTNDAIEPGLGSGVLRIALGEAVASLSTILLDSGYYEFIRTGKILRDGISTIGPDRLIPLKARAWLDLRERKGRGEQVDERDIRKHRNDIARLARVLDPSIRIELPEIIRADLRMAIAEIDAEGDLDPKALGIRNTTRRELLDIVVAVFETS